MRINKPVAVVAACIALACGTAGGAKRGTRSATFLKLSMSARAAGMGETLVAMAHGPEALFYNPGALVIGNSKSFEATHQELGNGTRYELAAAAIPLKERWGVAAGAGGYYQTNLVRTVADTAQEDGFRETGTFAAYDLLVTIGGGYLFWEGKQGKAGIGMAIKALRETIDNKSAAAVAADVGLAVEWRLKPKSKVLQRFGVVVQNLGTKMKFITTSYALPLSVTAGYSLSFFDGKMVPVIAVYESFEDTPEVRAGIEGKPFDMLLLRFGYRQRIPTNRQGFFGGMGGGFGLRYKRGRFDYSLSPNGDLGYQHRVTIGMNLP